MLLCVAILYTGSAKAQCTGCTATVSTNTSFTINSGQTVCLTYAGTFNQSINFNGGTLCIGSGTTVTTGINLNSGCNLIINGTMNGGIGQNSGTSLIVNSTGTLNPPYINFNGGTFSSSGTLNFAGGVSVNSGMGTWTSTGSLTASSFTNNGATVIISGGPVNIGSFTANGPTTFNTAVTLSSYTANSGGATTFNGAASISGSVTANSPVTFNSSASLGSFTANSGGTMIFNGATTVSGSSTANAAVQFNSTASLGSYTMNSGGNTSFATNATINGSLTNNTTLNITGDLTVTGNMTQNGGGSVNEMATGCHRVAVSGSLTNTGTFNGNGNGLLVTPANGTGNYNNGAYSIPTQQAGSLSLTLSGTTVTGTFSSPSANITGYIVLRYVGTTTPTDNPVNNTSYSVGNTIGSMTVVAVIPSGATGTRTFTDSVTTSVCGKNAYYRIFSYNAYSSCALYYNTNGPLTGFKTLTSLYVTITPSGPATFCSPGSVTLTATAGTAYLWSSPAGAAVTRAVTASVSGTYAVTVTSLGCTGTATQTVAANTAGAITPYLAVNGGALTNTATAGVCQGGSLRLAPQPAAGTWTVSGPGGYLAYSRDTTITNVQAGSAGMYTAIYTAGNGCTATQNYTVTVNNAPTATVTAPAGPQCAGTSVSLTATAGNSSGYSYAWSGPSGYSTTGATATISSPATSHTGTYTVTVTGAGSCTATASGALTVVTCLSVSGNIFDDANGNGIRTSGELLTNLGETLYGVLIDSASNKVLATSSVGSGGGFLFSRVLPNKSGLKVSIQISLPAVGSAAAGNSWPSGWVGTKAQYGTGNLAGSGVYGDTSQLLPVATGTSAVAGILMGYDRLPTTSTRDYSIAKPARNSTKRLTGSNGMGMMTAVDPEDGALGQGHRFIITSVAGMNGNKLYYDADGSTTLASYEEITGYTVITSFDSSKLYITFSGYASTSAVFGYNVQDAAGKSDPSPSVYNVHWNVALPVQMMTFDAMENGEAQVLLQWSTASEINNDRWDVERSADAHGWEKIGEVKGAGNSNEAIQYTLTDRAPATGMNYYRLRQLDYDGRYEYSDVVTVDMGNIIKPTVVMNIYPNPMRSNSGMNIMLSGSSAAIHYVKLTNRMGQTVYAKEAGDEQSHRVQGVELPVGVYTVNVLSDTGDRYSGKVVVE